MRSFSSVFCALVLSVSLAAQQLEPNTTGGSAMVNGQGPAGVGTPINVIENETLTLEIGGNASAPYTMFFGQLAPASLAVGTQFVDFNLAAPYGTLVDGLNLNLTPGGLPNTFGFLDATGAASWNFPLSSSAIGLTMCFQGAILDPSMPIGLNVTGCPEFTVAPIPPVNANFTGDDVVMAYALAAPISLYGHVTQDVAVSSNGWISLTNLATNSDLSESSIDFVSGAAGGAPAGTAPFVAALWEDLDMGNGAAGQQVDVLEVASGILQVSWTNGDYFSTTPFGTVVCIIDSPNGTVTFDYTGYNCATLPTEGLIGVSDGGVTGVSVPVETDLIVSGVPGYGASNPTETVWQNFDGTGAFSEVIDVTGVFMTFADLTGTGNWVVF